MQNLTTDQRTKVVEYFNIILKKKNKKEKAFLLHAAVNFGPPCILKKWVFFLMELSLYPKLYYNT